MALLVAAAALHLPQQSPLEGARLALFDAYQVRLPRERVSGPVAIVAIDEHSLQKFGQWPWPRDQFAALIERIAQHGPAAIGLDIIMPEHDATSPEALARSLPPSLAELKKASGGAADPRQRARPGAARARPSCWERPGSRWRRLRPLADCG